MAGFVWKDPRKRQYFETYVTTASELMRGVPAGPEILQGAQSKEQEGIHLENVAKIG